MNRLYLFSIALSVLFSTYFQLGNPFSSRHLPPSASPKEARTENQTNHTTVTEECSLANEKLHLNITPMVRPIWVPSFPGSGSSLFSELVMGTTGGEGADVYMSSKCTRTRSNRAIVTCKTHWPFLRRYNPVSLTDSFRDRFIYLIRNPRHAIPSLVNFQWEMKQGKSNHVNKAPEWYWRKRRDQELTSNLRRWEGMVSWWYLQGQYETALYLQYEKLIDNATGPELLRSVVNEMQQGLPDSVDLPIEDIPCIWHKIVMGGKLKRKSKSYTPGYTVEQKQQLLETLDRMILKYSDFNTTHGAPSATLTLQGILHDYRKDIEVNTPLDEVLFNDSSVSDSFSSR